VLFEVVTVEIKAVYPFIGMFAVGYAGLFEYCQGIIDFTSRQEKLAFDAPGFSASFSIIL
jgi:hypothetical protein